MSRRAYKLYIGRVVKRTRRPFLRVIARLGPDIEHFMARRWMPSTAQTFAWVFFFLVIPMQFIVHTVLFTPYMAIFFVVGVFLIYAQVLYLTFYEAVPDALREKRKVQKIKKQKKQTRFGGFKPQPYDPLRNRHVIEDSKCNICQIQVEPQTKHCRRCNMCVERFDHHCVWLNNCIGKNNYLKFLLLVFTLFTYSSLNCMASLVLLFLWFSRNPALQVDTFRDVIQLPFPIYGISEFNIWFWMAVTIGVFATSVLTAALTGHLLLFHIRLVARGQTTYNFIVSGRKKQGVSNETITNQDESGKEANQSSQEIRPSRNVLRPESLNQVHDSSSPSPRTVNSWGGTTNGESCVSTIPVPTETEHIHHEFKRNNTPDVIHIEPENRVTPLPI